MPAVETVARWRSAAITAPLPTKMPLSAEAETLMTSRGVWALMASRGVWANIAVLGLVITFTASAASKALDAKVLPLEAPFVGTVASVALRVDASRALRAAAAAADISPASASDSRSDG